ncbi:MAG: putative phosphoglycerate mutase [Chloroflexi bacterium]|nr:MAG: putative phosphoglycerate mutase [Chloroflexota bacterium]
MLIRHGQAGGPGVAYGSQAPLTELGLVQASHIATGLVSLGVTRIVSSPFVRARQTAEASAGLLRQPLELDDRLAEFQMGDEDEISIQEMMEEQRYLRLWQPHHSLSEHGETLAVFQERVSATLSEITRAPGASETLTQTVAVFTHGGTIAAGMRWAYGLTPEDNWHSDVEIHNASITEVEHWPLGRHPQGAPHSTALHRLNDVRHLPAALVTDF